MFAHISRTLFFVHFIHTPHKTDEWFQRKQGRRDAEYKATATAMKAEQYDLVSPSAQQPTKATDYKAQAMAEMNEQHISTLSSHEELKLRMACAKKNNNNMVVRRIIVEFQEV